MKRRSFVHFVKAHTGRACIASLFMLFFVTPAFGQSGTPAVSCESLAGLTLPNVTITTAQTVAAGQYEHADFNRPSAPKGGAGVTDPSRKTDGLGNVDFTSLPAFCRVAATVKTSSDSGIHMEVWMPLSGWNEKFMGVGNKGWSESISIGSLPDGLRLGYATASSDLGHGRSPGAAAAGNVRGQKNPGGSWLVGHPEMMIDFGYRATHEMTVNAKAITTAFYGTAPKHSYFFGDTMGGHQGLTEASRYPEDYDGICVGKPWESIPILNAAQVWPAILIANDPAKFIPEDKYAMVHEAVMNACDGLDGVKDGQITEPDHCNFDPGVLLCKGKDAPDCLTAPQLDLLQNIYQGPVNPRTHESVFPGAPFGDESEFFKFAQETPVGGMIQMIQYVVRQGIEWDWKTMNYDIDIALADKITGPWLTTPLDIKAFAARGGKLLIHTPWVEYHNPTDVVGMYRKAVTSVGDNEKARDAVRLFVVPCIGGASCDAFDKVAALDQWVESGKAPDQLLQSYPVGDRTRTRPLCAYPNVPRYKGTGDTDRAENFFCGESEYARKQ